jgi:multiple sugar transport system permease protein
MKIATSWRNSRGMIGFLLVLPAFIYGILVYYIPIGIAFSNSFRTGPLNALKYTGFSNYINIFTDRGFWETVRNTACFTLMAVVFIVFLAVIISIIINQVRESNLSNFYLVLFLAPTVVSFVAAGLIWSWMMDSTYGLLNTVITGFGFKKLLFLKDPKLVLFWLSAIQTWVRLGFAIVIIFGGLKSISNEYYEAALASAPPHHYSINHALHRGGFPAGDDQRFVRVRVDQCYHSGRSGGSEQVDHNVLI